GAPSAPERVRGLKEVFPKSTSGQGWGMTETCATVTSNGGEDYQNRPDSCGPAAAAAGLQIRHGGGGEASQRRPGRCGPAAGVGELQIRDAADGKTVLPVGTVGELWSKGPMNA